eukprot:1191817-Prorocentrum_minimum.AAC.4
MTAIKTDDIISTLQHLNLIQYQKGQHVLYANPKVMPDAGLCFTITALITAQANHMCSICFESIVYIPSRMTEHSGIWACVTDGTDCGAASEGGGVWMHH